ncbi:PIN domain-containing protein [Paracoccus sp. S-4012]|uniref:RSP_2648 family PIN domain-containing protein n=1 Tax=Paracoccus sp. S-4012 TaxID=2665648 RepID=UPI0012B008EE|nr:PIN domain-containing protein [Paracoccus sp. S-4012]MRX51402.1 PIN domain-containing protein [Paracoccus sp. S-4012]
MRAVLDACVLYPTVLREILIGAAEAGLIAPRWSPRILAEWTHAAARLGPEGERIARVEAALMADRFPDALAPDDGERARGLDLPDPADRHVVEAALASGATLIVTANLRDFPRGAMAAVGIEARHPDEMLLSLWRAEPEAVERIVDAVHARAKAAGAAMTRREMLKRVRLTRLAKALG